MQFEAHRDLTASNTSNASTSAEIGIQALALPPLVAGSAAATPAAPAAPRGGHVAGGRAPATRGPADDAWALPASWAVSGSVDGSMCVWETNGGECLQRESHKATVMAVSTALSADRGRPLVLSASADGECILWQVCEMGGRWMGDRWEIGGILMRGGLGAVC